MEYHKPVLLAEVLRQLKCSNGSRIVDCTIGGAGHAEAILNIISPDGYLLGIDEDNEAIEAAMGRLARFSQQIFLFKANYARLESIITRVGWKKVDGILFDLGVSSAQLDQEGRGFSYSRDAPLDMRMNQSNKLTAAEIINTYERERLTSVLRHCGEEKWASRIAAFIVEKRRYRPIESSGRLVEIVKAAIPASARRRGGNPAKRVFQALRIEVNQELKNLRQALTVVPNLLSVGGRLVVISYNSLEDRIVKNWLREQARGCTCPPAAAVCVCGRQAAMKIITKKPLRPTAAELAANPRSHSAKMRVGERVSA